MDPEKSPGTHYGALRALMSITHSEGVQMLILPNLKVYNDDVLKVKLGEENNRNDTERVVNLLLRALESVAASSRLPLANGTTDLEDLRERLNEKVGDVLTDRIIARQRKDVAEYLLKVNTSI
jgi:transcription initiation factor TFIID subunit 6